MTDGSDFDRQMKEWVMIVMRDRHGLWMSDVIVATTVPDGAEGEVPRMECQAAAYL